jgi:hypothetical protein
MGWVVAGKDIFPEPILPMLSRRCRAVAGQVAKKKHYIGTNK